MKSIVKSNKSKVQEKSNKSVNPINPGSDKRIRQINKQGNPSMVDVTEKQVTHRTATARSVVVLPDEVLQHLVDGDLISKKGPVFQTAIIAGIMAAKKTGDLIPLCHPLGMDNCSIT